MTAAPAMRLSERIGDLLRRPDYTNPEQLVRRLRECVPEVAALEWQLAEALASPTYVEIEMTSWADAHDAVAAVIAARRARILPLPPEAKP